MPSCVVPPRSADQYDASPLNGHVVWNDVLRRRSIRTSAGGRYQRSGRPVSARRSGRSDVASSSPSSRTSTWASLGVIVTVWPELMGSTLWGLRQAEHPFPEQVALHQVDPADERHGGRGEHERRHGTAVVVVV